MSARGFSHRPVRRLPRDQPQGDDVAARQLTSGRTTVVGRGVRRSGRGALDDLSPVGVQFAAQELKAAVREVTGGITGSGVASSKLVAKIASELDKPDGLVVVPHGSERELLRPMQVTVIPGGGRPPPSGCAGSACTRSRIWSRSAPTSSFAWWGQSHGRSLYRLARAEDDRPVVTERESKSVSIEDTFDTDLVDPTLLKAIVERHAARVCERLRALKLSGRTVTVKIRMHDFTTHTRSATLAETHRRREDGVPGWPGRS